MINLDICSDFHIIICKMPDPSKPENSSISFLKVIYIHRTQKVDTLRRRGHINKGNTFS